jgi:diguanylate cyclase (GGDEF)-like protein/PAS domain S-box-containing protein
VDQQQHGIDGRRASPTESHARLRATLDSLLDPHLVLSAVRDAEGRVVDLGFEDANDAACDYLRTTRTELLGTTVRDRFPGVVASGLLARSIEILDTGVPLVIDDTPFLNEAADEERYYDIRGVRLDDSLVFTIRDVTDRHEAAARVAESEQRYRLLAENAWDVIWTMAVDGTITYVSPSVERVRGITPEEAAAQSLDQIHPPDSAAQVSEYFSRLYEAMATGEVPPTYHGEREYYRKDGSIMLGELQVIPQVDAAGDVVQILGVTRDITERRFFEQELERLAVTDPLTGVLNRRQGEELFTADMVEARRHGPALSLLMLDIDHFKSVNDTYGHLVGDGVLIEMSRRIVANLRTSDALARWGGEEFVVMMRHCTLDDAMALGEKLRALVADEPFDDVGTVTVSIGAAELRPDDDFGSWIDRADRCMYEAKAAGRNAVRGC